MQEHAADIASFLERCTYGIGGFTTLGCFVELLDKHTWIVSMFGMMLTFAGTMFFKWLDYRLKVKTLKVDE